MSISLKLPLIFIITLLFTIINAVISINSLQKYSEDQQWVTHSYQVTLALERFFSEVRDNDINVREYITTDQPQYLTTYSSSQKNAKETLQSLQTLTKDNQEEEKYISTLEPLMAQRINLLDQSIAIKNEQGADAARMFLQQGNGVSVMTSIQPVIQKMEDTESTLLAIRTVDAKKSLQNTLATIILANLLDFLLIGISYYFFIRELQSRTVLEQRKNDFISMASHELKTPLTSMKAFVYALKKYVKTPQAQRWIYKLDSQVKNQTKLINELLDHSRMQEGKLSFAFEATNINQVVEDAVETVQATVKHKIIIKGHAKKKVYCDSQRIGQVIINLLSNAVKYSPNAKKVIVYIENMRNKVKIRVQDFGIGIPKKDLTNVFNRFYRVEHDKEKEFPGLGLGLFITAGIIERHHGTLNVKSKEGKGSTFSFTLPYARKG